MPTGQRLLVARRGVGLPDPCVHKVASQSLLFGAEDRDPVGLVQML